VQPCITMPTMMSVNASPLSSNRDSTSRRRTLSEPSAVTDVCLKSDMPILGNAVGSVELMKQTDAADYAKQVDLCAMVSSSAGSSDKTVCVTTGSHSVTVTSSVEVHRASALIPTESCIKSISSVDEKCSYVPAAESGSVWRKVKPHNSMWVAKTSEQGSFRSEPAFNNAGISHVPSLSGSAVRNGPVDGAFVSEMWSDIEHGSVNVRSDLNAVNGSVAAVVDNDINNVEKSLTDDNDVDCLLLPLTECETNVDAAADSDSSHNETGYDLTDNNAVVTAHQLRDDIPDSELIDYSDDGGESLIDCSSTSAKEQVHVFIALFDYDPATMSPNPDAVESELPFSEGQLIKVGFTLVYSVSTFSF